MQSEEKNTNINSGANNNDNKKEDEIANLYPESKLKILTNVFGWPNLRQVILSS